MSFNYWILLFTIFASPLSFATSQPSQEVCINGASESNNKLIQSFRGNKDPLKLAFLENKKNRKRLYPFCAENTDSKNLRPIQELSRSITDAYSSSQSPTFIRRECIAASMKRNPGNAGYACDYPTAKEVKLGYGANVQSVPRPYGVAGGKTLQCMNNEMVDYLHFSVNNAIQCLSPNDPIDSRVIFQKLNNETGFNYSLAWRGGVGLGQTTTPAKDELTAKIGNGKYILENVANSHKKSCESFKEIAKRDLKQPPRIQASNYCAWVNSGNGLARNLLYSIGYYLTMRDQYILPALNARSPKLAKNRDVVSNLTAISYGAEGIKHARWLMQKFRISDNTSPENYLKSLQKNSTYLTGISNKIREVHCLKKSIATPSSECSNIILTPEELSGESCVSPLF